MKLNIVKLFLIIYLVIVNFAKAQDLIVPIPIDNNWPLSSPILDSVEYFTAKNIAANNVSRCEIYRENGELDQQLFYDREGRLISEQYIRKNELSYEIKYTRNNHGQITEEAHISYSSSKEGVTVSISKYEYLRNKPTKAFLYCNSSSPINQKAVYSGDTLSGFGYIESENSESKRLKKIFQTKDASGVYTFIEDNTKHSLFESVNMDSVVAGDFTRTFYTVKDHKIVTYKHNGIDYITSNVFYYDKNGLISYSEDEFRDIVSRKSKSFYKYYYYED